MQSATRYLAITRRLIRPTVRSYGLERSNSTPFDHSRRSALGSFWWGKRDAEMWCLRCRERSEQRSNLPDGALYDSIEKNPPAGGGLEKMAAAGSSQCVSVANGGTPRISASKTFDLQRSIIAFPGGKLVLSGRRALARWFGRVEMTCAGVIQLRCLGHRSRGNLVSCAWDEGSQWLVNASVPRGTVTTDDRSTP